MPDKGKVMSQSFYEKQSRLYQLFQESFTRKEMNTTEAITALRIIGFSKSIAARRVNEWARQSNDYMPETETIKKRRLKKQASLEKYILYMKLGKKYYSNLESKHKDKEFSKDKVISILMQSRHSRELAESIVKNWESNKAKEKNAAKTP